VLRNVLFKRQMSTLYCLRKCSSLIFLYSTSSAFRQARRRTLLCPAILGRAVTNRITVFPADRVWAASLGREEVYVRSRKISSANLWMGSRSRRSEVSSNVEVGLFVGTTKSGVVSLPAAVLRLVASFILDFPAAGLRTRMYLGSAF